jgi:hypothetical protein
LIADFLSGVNTKNEVFYLFVKSLNRFKKCLLSARCANRRLFIMFLLSQNNDLTQTLTIESDQNNRYKFVLEKCFFLVGGDTLD